MNKGVVVAGGTIIGFALLAILGKKAKAASANKPAVEDIHSPEACKAYQASRTNLLNERKQIQAQLNDVNSAMNDAAAAGDESALANLVSIRQGLLGSLSNVNGQIAQVDNLIVGCA